MKICKKCNTKKELNQFTKDKRNSDGRTGVCYKCKRKYFKEYYQGNKSKFRQIQKKYESKEIGRRKRAEIVKRYQSKSKKFKAYQKEYQKHYYKKSDIIKKKYRARNLLNKKINSGKMVRGKCCYSNGKCSEKIEGHHDNYDKPYDVRWFCSKHHALIERILRIKKYVKLQV